VPKANKTLLVEGGVLFTLSVPLASNPNALLIVKAIGEGFGFLLWLD